MIDIRLLREDAAAVRATLARRAAPLDGLDRIAALDVTRRAAITRAEEAKAAKNTLSREIGALKKAGQSADDLMAKSTALADAIAIADAEAAAAETSIQEILLSIPNVPDTSIPDSGNAVVKTVRGPEPGAEPAPAGEPHWDIATRLGLCDFERGTKLAGARFYALTGAGARLERALINFMLDRQAARGYTEVVPPLLANIASMTGTGQYPKFQEEYFQCEKDGLALIPTAEVPLTNLHRDEILPALPVRYTAVTPCFRREAGAAGKDTRGLTRVHQFHKIELVIFARPEDSPALHEELTSHAEAILEELGLPYRRLLLAADDLGFASAKTYDLEIWMPGQGRYVEVSSCSNFTDYQARRMKIRWKRPPEEGGKGKPELVHTLNGSGLAVGRTWAALLENGLQPDGSVLLPEVLAPYMDGVRRLAGR